MDKTKLEQLKLEIQKVIEDNHLSCAQAFAIADKLGVTLGSVGNAANDLKVKIVACRLGCF